MAQRRRLFGDARRAAFSSGFGLWFQDSIDYFLFVVAVGYSIFNQSLYV